MASGVFGAAEVEVPAGGLPPAVGGEGGCPCLLLIPGRAHVHVTAGSRSPESISGAAGAASSSFVVPQVWGAGGAAAAAEADGGCLRPASGPGRARVHVTSGCQPPEYDLGAAAAAFLFWIHHLTHIEVEGGIIGGRLGLNLVRCEVFIYCIFSAL